MHPSEHGLSAVICQSICEPLSITGPSPYTDTTEPLPAYCGILRSRTGWWGIVVHPPRGVHPQTAIQDYETEHHPVVWCGFNASIGLHRLPNQPRVVSARIREEGLAQMKRVIAEESGIDFAESRFNRRRVPAGVRYLPGKQLQLWFSL